MLIKISKVGLLNEISILSFGRRDFLNFSCVKYSEFHIGMDIDFSLMAPIHIGLSLGYFIFLFSIAWC